MLYFTAMKTKEILMVCAAALFAGCAGLFGIGGKDATVGLKVNHLTAPANVSAKPVFSWKMASGRAGARQTAYQIEVREDALDGRMLWRSGTVESDVSIPPRASSRRDSSMPTIGRVLSGFRPSIPMSAPNSRAGMIPKPSSRRPRTAPRAS